MTSYPAVRQKAVVAHDPVRRRTHHVADGGHQQRRRRLVTGPFSITVAFSEPVTGFELEDLVVGNGSASELQGNNASYMATITPAASGTVTVAIAAGAARDGGGNPSAAAVQFSIVADLTPGPALPVSGALALALLLLGGGARRRTAS